MPDASFLTEDFRELFTSKEFDSILEDVRSMVLPYLDIYVSELQKNYHSKYDPLEHFDYLITALIKFHHAFSTDLEAVKLVSNCLESIFEIINNLESEIPKKIKHKEDLLRKGEFI